MKATRKIIKIEGLAGLALEALRAIRRLEIVWAMHHVGCMVQPLNHAMHHVGCMVQPLNHVGFRALEVENENEAILSLRLL